MHRICRLHIGDLRWIRPGSLIPPRPPRPKIGNVAAAHAAMPASTKFTAAKKPNMTHGKMPKKKKCCRNKTINRITLVGIFPLSFQTDCFAKSPPKPPKKHPKIIRRKNILLSCISACQATQNIQKNVWWTAINLPTKRFSHYKNARFVFCFWK